MNKHSSDLPVRVGVFSTVSEADRAIRQLLAAGFRKEQFQVICSDEHKEQLFKDLPSMQPGSAYTTEGIAAGTLVGATLGGLALAVSTFVTGGANLVAGGLILVGGGALAGSFSGAMATRGFEKEAANYYEQEVEQGKILVSVEEHEDEAKLAEADRIFAEAGANPVPLVEG